MGVVADEAFPAQARALAELSEGLVGEFRLRPLLERVLRSAVELLGCADGSISLVDHGSGTYRKEADVGVACQSGRTFPLDEGVTGAVVRTGGPVVVADYAQVAGGHLHPVDRARLHAAVGVPVRWGPAVVGVVVVFSEDPDRRFDERDTELLGLFARHAAIAITNARLHAVAAERGRAEAAALERERSVREVQERVGRQLAAVLVHLDAADAGEAVAAAQRAARRALALARQAGPGVPEGPRRPALEDALAAEVAWARTAAGLDGRFLVAGQVRAPDEEVTTHLLRATRAAVVRAVASSRARTLRVGLVHRAEGVVLLVEDDGPSAEDADAALQQLAAGTRALGGTADVTATPGWGTSLRLSLPYRLGDPGRSPRAGVLVVDGRPALRAGLAALLACSGGAVRVLGDVGRAADVPAAVRLLRPDVVLVGTRLPDASPAQVTAGVLGDDATASVVLVDDTAAGMPVPGLRGRVPADATGPELVQALLRAAEPSPQLGLRAADPDGRAPTPRELEVLRLLERGCADREIAERLVISRKTVEKHVGALLRKHGVHSRAALVALRAQLLTAG